MEGKQETTLALHSLTEPIFGRRRGMTEGIVRVVDLAPSHPTLYGESIESNSTTYLREGRLRLVSHTGLHYLFAKRVLDIIGSLVGLILLSPLFLLLTILVRIGSPGPALHRRRVLAKQTCGEGNLQQFDAFKFRTMVVDADTLLERNPELMEEYRKEFKLHHDPRITRIGGPLRRASLDEVPQLWNVLMGQMSLVGPRMITAPELDHYGANAERLLSVKPGITGLWQVSGRTDVSYQERVRLDMYYIENRSLRMDIEILLRTVICVLARRGAI
jgi:lipopolysaccharide/colanic/teichoic acid biosynthesis glycosyltransferase